MQAAQGAGLLEVSLPQGALREVHPGERRRELLVRRDHPLTSRACRLLSHQVSGPGGRDMHTPPRPCLSSEPQSSVWARKDCFPLDHGRRMLRAAVYVSGDDVDDDLVSNNRSDPVEKGEGPHRVLLRRDGRSGSEVPHRVASTRLWISWMHNNRSSYRGWLCASAQFHWHCNDASCFLCSSSALLNQ